MWFWLMYFIVLPSETLNIELVCLFSLCSSIIFAHLCDSDGTPFLLPEQLQGSGRLIMILFGDCFEHGLWELDMTVFKVIIGVS